ncbi:MAG: bifunctional histidine phosphatase family protein/GNAT family N-acetyltransferase [Oscillospiraceae bacterium]|nr:bifunctional histidine phosphatase family protein/GNAT family N-acetyltransferase [Oscillospiraceae bacterium]
MKIFWIRHCEAEGNLYRRCHGQYNGLVTENGKAQLSALQKRFENTKIDAIYSSDLYRAWRTANALAEPRGLIVTTHKGLREIFLGPWEDMPWVETKRGWPEDDAAFSLRPWEFALKSAETIDEIVERGVSALREIVLRHKSEDSIAIVSHGMFTRALMTRISGLSVKEINTLPHGDNTSVSVLNYENNKYSIELYADNSHLGELSTLAQQSWWREGTDTVDPGFLFRTPDFKTESKRVEAYRRDAWFSIYGDLVGYEAGSLLNMAREQQAGHPRAVVFAVEDGEPVGILQLDVEANLKPGTGHISFFYLEPRCRGKGMGVQLLGHAVSVYRELGRSEVVLRVADSNEHALYFYKKHGFKQFGIEDGHKGQLLLLSLDITVPPNEPSVQWR